MFVKTQKQLAKYMRLSDRSVRELQSRGIVPLKGPKGYDLALCVGDYIEHLRAVASGHLSDDGDLDLTEQRARLAKEQADAQGMKNEVLRGALLPREDVVAAVQGMIANARARLLSIPSKYAPRLEGLGPHEIKDELTGAVHDALDELAATRVVAGNDSEDIAGSGEGGDGSDGGVGKST